jgi:hypothetical protein
MESSSPEWQLPYPIPAHNYAQPFHGRRAVRLWSDDRNLSRWSLSGSRCTAGAALKRRRRRHPRTNFVELERMNCSNDFVVSYRSSD